MHAQNGRGQKFLHACSVAVMVDGGPASARATVLPATPGCLPSAYIRTGLDPSWPAEESPRPLVLAVTASTLLEVGKHSSVSAATVRQSTGREQGMSVTCFACGPVFALFTMFLVQDLRRSCLADIWCSSYDPASSTTSMWVQPCGWPDAAEGGLDHDFIAADAAAARPVRAAVL